MGVGDHAAHLRGRIVGDPELDGDRVGDHALEHLVVQCLVEEEPARRATALAADAGEVGALDDRRCRDRRIHVGVDDDRVLAAELERDALELAGLGGARVDPPPGRQ